MEKLILYLYPTVGRQGSWTLGGQQGTTLADVLGCARGNRSHRGGQEGATLPGALVSQ
jgi:hypothetical protein